MLQTSNDYLDTKIGTFHKDPSISTIYIGNLDYSMNELEIKDLFEEYGYVNYVKLIKDPESYQSKGIAFIQMNNRKQAMFAISQINGSQIQGRTLKVNLAQEDDKNRRKKGRRKPYKPYISKKDRVHS